MTKGSKGKQEKQVACNVSVDAGSGRCSSRNSEDAGVAS